MSHYPFHTTISSALRDEAMFAASSGKYVVRTAHSVQTFTSPVEAADAVYRSVIHDEGIFAIQMKVAGIEISQRLSFFEGSVTVELLP